MATTRTSPNLDWSQAGSDLYNLFLDTARSKLIDVEMAGDERTIPDQTDLRTGMLPTNTAAGTAAPQVQNSIGPQAGAGTNWLMLGGVAAAAGALVYFMAD